MKLLKQIASLAIDIFNDFAYENKKIPGFGHRYHETDPRALRVKESEIIKALRVVYLADRK